jgi:hypothetical protein
MVSLFFTKKYSFLVLFEVLGGSCSSGSDYGSGYNSCNSYSVIVIV